ncbi:DUF3316 domain-containing protein [Vibrio sp. CDRSL-10 TSBA]
MKKALVILTTMSLSAGAFAAISTAEKETTIATGAYQSQQLAYDAGFQMVDHLNQLPGDELAQELNIFDAQIATESLKVTDAEVKVEPFAPKDGHVQYRALVDVDYQYTVREGQS